MYQLQLFLDWEVLLIVTHALLIPEWTTGSLEVDHYYIEVDHYHIPRKFSH